MFRPRVNLVTSSIIYEQNMTEMLGLSIICFYRHSSGPREQQSVISIILRRHTKKKKKMPRLPPSSDLHRKALTYTSWCSANAWQCTSAQDKVYTTLLLLHDQDFRPQLWVEFDDTMTNMMGWSAQSGVS